MSNEDLEEACGNGDRKDRFDDERCPELSYEVRWIVNNCRRNGINLAQFIKRTTPD